MTEKLKPCPFCGDIKALRVASTHEDEEQREHSETWQVVCDASTGQAAGWNDRRIAHPDDVFGTLPGEAAPAPETAGWEDSVNHFKIQTEALAQVLDAAITRLKQLGETSWELPPYAKAMLAPSDGKERE